MPSPTTVIEQFLHPPLAVLQRELVPGVFFDSGVLTRPRGPVPVDAFGLSLEFFTVPAGFGFTVGNVNVYQERMVQISIAHTMLDGHDVISETFDLFTDNVPVVWEQALPSYVQYFIAPGVFVNFFWLVAL